MADRYIDYEETLIYGPYAVRKMKTVALGLVPAFDAALTYLMGELNHATDEMGQALERARTSDVSHRDGIQDKRPLLQQAQDLLRRFSNHLDAHRKGSVDKKRFFASGLPSEIGKNASRILLALGHITQELAKKDCGVTDAKAWQKEFSELAAALAPAVEHSDSAKTARRAQSAELEQTRAAWMLVYGAAKLTLEAILRLGGQSYLLRTIFYDLAVPGDAKITAPPTEPLPAAVPAEAEDAPKAPAAAPKPARKRSR